MGILDFVCSVMFTGHGWKKPSNTGEAGMIYSSDDHYVLITNLVKLVKFLVILLVETKTTLSSFFSIIPVWTWLNRFTNSFACDLHFFLSSLFPFNFLLFVEFF